MFKVSLFVQYTLNYLSGKRKLSLKKNIGCIVSAMPCNIGFAQDSTKFHTNFHPAWIEKNCSKLYLKLNTMVFSLDRPPDIFIYLPVQKPVSIKQT